MKVDYVVTHTIPKTLIETVMRAKVPYEERFLAGYLDRIMSEVKFTKWFFGHWHEDKIIKRNLCYNPIYTEYQELYKQYKEKETKLFKCF